MHIINLVILIAKQNIFQFWCSKEKLSVSCVKSEIQFIQKYELQKAMAKGKVASYNNKWGTDYPTEHEQKYMVQEYINQM